MAQKRSGAQRRSWQRNHQQHNATPRAVGAGDSVKGHQTSKAKLPPLQPAAQDVIAAVASLYLDQLKPYGRILRKRLVERYVAVSAPGCELAENQPDVDPQHLRATCDACEQLCVAPEEGGDWSVTLTGCSVDFVDIYGSGDVYPEDLWAGLAAYLDSASVEDTTLPGGRYSCAKTLLTRKLPCFENRTLGQVCHVVQLAISDRKLLGYLDGSVVPYFRSGSMQKELCASQKQPPAIVCQEAVGLPIATLKQAVDGMRQLLEEAVAASKESSGLGALSISNIKRMFRVQFQLELSETALGHSKLSELLQDQHFASVCEVYLEGNGYSVVLRTDAAAAPLVSPTGKDATEESDNVKEASWRPPSPICVDFGFAETPGPFAPTPNRERNGLASQPQDYSCLMELLPLCLQDASCRAAEDIQQPRPFCIDEPLELAAADGGGHSMPAFGKTPSLFSPPAAWPQYVDERFSATPPAGPEIAGNSGFCSGEPLRIRDAFTDDHCWITTSSWKDCTFEGMILSTFIQAPLPPQSPLAVLRESSSLQDSSLLPVETSTMPTLSSSRCSDSLHHSTDAEPPSRVLCLADYLVF